MDIVTGMARDARSCLALVEKYRDRRLADRVFELAWTHSQVLLRQLNATESRRPTLRAPGQLRHLCQSAPCAPTPSFWCKNRRGQSGLWGYAISGDLPIVLLQIGDPANIELVRQLVQAHAYWRLKGLAVDLVIWNEDHSGYRQDLHEQILGLIAAGTDANVKDRPGGIFVRPPDQIASEDRILFQSVARAILTDTRGTLAEQVASAGAVEAADPGLARPTRAYRPTSAQSPSRLAAISSSSTDWADSPGRPRVRHHHRARTGDARAWVNVLANPHFGTVVSESGIGLHLGENAHEFRLTPWDNDPVSDTSGEAFYLRDEETRHFWSPTPLPGRGAQPYVTRHGFGYSVFEHTEDGIHVRSCGCTWPPDAPVKFTVLKIRNDSGRARRLSATGYVEWVLGDLRPKIGDARGHRDSTPPSGALFARNPYNTEFAGRVAFFDVRRADAHRHAATAASSSDATARWRIRPP